MILNGSEIERLIAERHSGLVRVIRCTEAGRLEQVGYLLLREGAVKEHLLPGAGSAREAVQKVAEDRSLYIQLALEDSAGKHSGALDLLDISALEDYE